MRKDERLQQLFSTIRAGELSRNRHFDRYLTADVLNASARAKRLDRLWLMLDRAATEQWCFSLLPTSNQSEHELVCQSPLLEGRWRALLFDFELRALSEHPRASDLIPELHRHLDLIVERHP